MPQCPECPYTAERPGSVNAHRGKKHPGAPGKFCHTCLAEKTLDEFRTRTGIVKQDCASCRQAGRERGAGVQAVIRSARGKPSPRLELEAAAPGHCTAEQRAARWAYYGGRCWMCGRPADVMDHVKPLFRGGSNWPSNQRPACHRCNLRKAANWPLPDWIAA